MNTRPQAGLVMWLAATPVRARLVLTGLIVLFGVATVVPIPRAAPAGLPTPIAADSQMFTALITRLRSNEHYYAITGDELRNRFQPTASIFNWKMPFPYETAARLPDAAQSSAFLLLSALVVGFAAVHLVRSGVAAMAVLAIATQAGVLYAMWPARLMTEPWCGLLIAFSALAYARSFWIIGAVAALLSLFVRELAAPYCVACVLIALSARRRHELMLWAGGAVLFAVVYSAHVAGVWAHQRPGDLISPPWVRLGGVRFILETVRDTNGWLVRLPQIATAIAVVLMAAAPWSPSIPMHISATVIVYALFFFVVGQVFNDYWGFVVAATGAIALAYGYSGIRFLTDQSFVSTRRETTLNRASR